MVYNVVMDKVLVPLQKSGTKVLSVIPSVQEEKWSVRLRKKKDQQSLRPMPELCSFLIEMMCWGYLYGITSYLTPKECYYCF